MRSTVDHLNYLNILLMALSAIVAIARPFETFLFAYAFLGPLHYLTEIGWLHERRYFTRGRYDHLFLAGAGVAATLVFFRLVPGVPAHASALILFVAFAAALVFAKVSQVSLRAGLIALAGVCGMAWLDAGWFETVFGIFLPTLIHVFLFTGMFILVGALRGRSLSGLLSLAAFASIALGVCCYQPSDVHPVSAYVRDSYGILTGDGNWSSGFIALNYQIMTALDLHDFGSPAGGVAQFIDGINGFLYGQPLARPVMAFIAFAYLYHYLNWFSKTSLIGWHKLPRGRLLLVACCWLGAVLLFVNDYATGMKVLYFLSITHVLLEFPLNHLTLISVVKESAALLCSARVSGTEIPAVRQNG